MAETISHEMQTRKMNAPAAPRRTVLMALAALLAFVLAPVRSLARALAPSAQEAAAAVLPALPAGSRRAVLAAMREERANLDDNVKLIIVGSVLFALGIVIALIMYPIATAAVAEAEADPNSTARDVTLMRLLPTILVLVVLLAGLGIMFLGFKGLSGKGR